jgi:hypothetical protein
VHGRRCSSARWLNSANTGSSAGGSKNKSSSSAIDVPGPMTGSLGWSPVSTVYAETAVPVSPAEEPVRAVRAEGTLELNQC